MAPLNDARLGPAVRYLNVTSPPSPAEAKGFHLQAQSGNHAKRRLASVMSGVFFCLSFGVLCRWA